MINWREIETAPRNGTLVRVGYYDDGDVLDGTIMRWSPSRRNSLFPGVVGMWESQDGSFTWDESNGFGPTHWSYIEQ